MELSRSAFAQGWSYFRGHGFRAFVRRCFELWIFGAGEAPVGSASAPLIPAVAAPPPAPVDELLSARFVALAPFPVYPAVLAERRITLVTDSINAGSLFGGVATAIILAALLAERRGARLRVVTRTEPALEDNFAHVLEANDIALHANVEFQFVPHRDATPLEVGVEDVFLTTSWWTTAAVSRSVPPAQIVYLLQEDERMFYPLGDDHLRCSEQLGDEKIRFVVNTRMLHTHLVNSGLPHLARQGTWFEPAFNERSFHRAVARPPGKKQFFFYARPNNLRNLFYRGLEAIELAVERGVLDLDAWDVSFVGKDLPEIQIGPGIVPKAAMNLSWQSYGELVRSMDLGLCLMYTPHPSYPPLDLVASGGVAVTNRFPGKTELAHYSDNIVCVDLDVESLVEGIARGVALAEDEPRRAANFGASRIQRDWRASFAAVLDRMA